MINKQPTKVCGCCKKEKSVDDFYTRSDTGGYKSICKTCDKKRANQWQRKEYRENKKFRQAGVDRMAEWRKRPENIEHHKELAKKHRKKTADKARGTLADSYVVHVLVNHSPLGSADIPKSLIEVKRQELLIQRELRRRNV